VGAAVGEAARGLLALGLQPGERVGLLSRSRAEWVQADFAILSGGGVTVPIYPTWPPEHLGRIVADAGPRVLLAEDPGQLEKVLEIWASLPGLERVVVLEGYEGHDPRVLTWEGLRRLGRVDAEGLGAALSRRLGACRPEDIATIVYTSGTTGLPKGVVQTHGNHLAMLTSVALVSAARPGDTHLLFLPLAHSFGRLEAFTAVYLGLTTAFAESLDRLPDNLREIRPDFIVAVPRVFEKLHARITAGVQARGPLPRLLFRCALGLGLRASRREQRGERVPLPLRLLQAAARRVVFGPLHRTLGGRLRFAVSGGAPLPGAIAEFFHAAGILILEGYGLTESCPVLTANRPDRFRLGSVGVPVPGVELALAPDGEILARGPSVATRGYWGQPEATAEAFTADGWLRTGDLGRVDPDGFVYIADRKKDIIVTAGGINIAPQAVERLLLRDPLVSQAMVYGDRRPYPVALLSLGAEALRALARAEGLADQDHAALTRHPAVWQRVARAVEAANQELPSYARVKRFAVLPADLSEAGGELTPTQRIRRRVVARRYARELDALYAPEGEPAPVRVSSGP
jgi:long-chain acyl-CoA synthetase